MLNCNFCHKEFKNNSSLNKHKLTAKYCLKIQDVIGDKIENDCIDDCIDDTIIDCIDNQIFKC